MAAGVPEGRRRLAAILAAVVASASGLMAEDGAAALPPRSGA